MRSGAEEGFSAGRLVDAAGKIEGAAQERGGREEDVGGARVGGSRGVVRIVEEDRDAQPRHAVGIVRSVEVEEGGGVGVIGA